MSVIKINADNFQAEALAIGGTVLLDFYATWCGPCRMVAPILEEIAAEYPAIKVGKIDVDEEEALAGQFGVASIPTLVALKNGQEVGRLVGAHPKSAILNLLK